MNTVAEVIADVRQSMRGVVVIVQVAPAGAHDTAQLTRIVIAKRGLIAVNAAAAQPAARMIAERGDRTARVENTGGAPVGIVLLDGGYLPECVGDGDEVAGPVLDRRYFGVLKRRDVTHVRAWPVDGLELIRHPA